MAHLRPGDPDPTPRKSGRDRAQLILLAGFALAAVFVAFAFLLNSVIYTENLATRGEAAKTSQAVIVVDDAAAGTEGIVGYANEHNTSTYEGVVSDPYDPLEDELVSGIADLELLMGTQELANGGVVTVEHVSYREGAWVDQSSQAENFTDANGQTDWELVDGADGVRSFRIHVTDPDELEDISILDTPSGSANNFTVRATNGSHTWTMEAYHHDTDLVDAVPTDTYVVEVTDGDGDTRYCSVSDTDDSGSDISSLWINVSEGTFAGSECRALRFGEDVSTVETVDYENGRQIYGTYRLIVAQDVPSVYSSTTYNGTGGPPPVVQPAVYNTTISVSFESDNLYYETERDVELREADDE